MNNALRNTVHLMLAMLVLSVIAPASFAAGGSSGTGGEARKLRVATVVLKDITSNPEKGLPPALLRNAYAIAIFPGVVRTGYIEKGRRGLGVISVRGDKGWSAPSFLTIAGENVGWPVGPKSIDVVLIFKDRNSVDEMLKGKLTLGVEASVAAGPVGRQAGASTDVQRKAEIYSYLRSRDIFSGVSLEGAALKTDYRANESFYEKKGVTAKEILTWDAEVVPRNARFFRKALTKMTSSR